MSRCHCEDSQRFRVTGEVYDRQPDPRATNEIGSGEKMARIRCAECGGKVTYVGSDLLNVLGIPDGEIQNGRVLPEGERPVLEVDLI